MVNIDLSNLNQMIMDNITNQEFDKKIRKQILDDIENEEHYDLACQVFNQTSEIYFKLGFQIASTF